MSDGIEETVAPVGSGWRRLVVSLCIGAYLTALVYGVLLHAFDLPGKVSVPGYLVVWDMYCGWAAYERRLHFIAEGASGTYYDAGAVPGSDTTPHGSTPRRHFDFVNRYGGAFAAHVLSRTDHEPIQRVFIVEESWSKRYNLPDALRDDVGSPEKVSYWHTQAVCAADGSPFQVNRGWIQVQNDKAVFDNPRLRAAMNKRPAIMAVNRSTSQRQ